IQTRLGLTGKIGEQQRDHVTLMAIAMASHHDSSRMKSFVGQRGLQVHCHFRPGRDSVLATKLDSVLAESYGARRETQASRVGLNREWLKYIRVAKFSCAHTIRRVTYSPQTSNWFLTTRSPPPPT